jgi:hypothetical protein
MCSKRKKIEVKRKEKVKSELENGENKDKMVLEE